LEGAGMKKYTIDITLVNGMMSSVETDKYEIEGPFFRYKEPDVHEATVIHPLTAILEISIQENK
jgi:hypothetical protein